MPIFDNIAGVQRQVAKSYSNINGVWHEDSKVYDNINEVWRETHSGNPTCTVTLSMESQKIGWSDSTLSGNNLHVGNGVQQTDSSTYPSISKTILRIVFSDNISYTSLSGVINNISLKAYSYIRSATAPMRADIYLTDLINSQNVPLWVPTFPLPETTNYAPSPLIGSQSFSGISNTFEISFTVTTMSQSSYASVHIDSLADILLSDISICGIPLVLA